MTATRVVHVAVAVLRDAAGRVLVAQRLPHQHLAGLWEFPGGKVEPGESLFDGMRREIREELGITVEQLAPLLRIEHTYPEKTVLLDVWRVLRWSGPAPGATGAEGQPLRWVQPADMIAAEFPPADVPIINALCLPPSYAITPDVAAGDDAAAQVAAFVATLGRENILLVQVRLKQQPLLAPAFIAAIRASRPQARILINSDTVDALNAGRAPAAASQLCGADGIHLTSTALLACREKPAALVAASCHNEAELAQAFALGIDFATLSPVLATTSHPAVTPMGWEKFSSQVKGSGLPVYALGGLRRPMLDEALRRGAIGLAGISAFSE